MGTRASYSSVSFIVTKHKAREWHGSTREFLPGGMLLVMSFLERERAFIRPPSTGCFELGSAVVQQPLKYLSSQLKVPCYDTMLTSHQSCILIISSMFELAAVRGR